MCSGPGGKGGWFKDPAFENLGKVPSSQLWEQYLDKGRRSHRYYEIHKKRWALSDPFSTLAMREQLFSQTPQLNKVASTRIRAHVIFGENDDAWPIQDQLDMAEKISAKVTILAGCGHCPNEDDPGLTSDQLMKFWSTLD
jgi:pimeloyl-ACP methyl ester carboxylesterase